MNNIYTVILAAGAGTRMKSNTPKTLHEICGKSMIDYVLDGAKALSDNKPIIVVGHEKEKVMEHLDGKAEFVVQKKQLGTGHAVMMAKELLADKKGYVLIMAGDMPLTKKETLLELYDKTKNEGSKACVLTAWAEDPYGYGRVIIKDENVVRIVEEKDATEKERTIQEVNTAIYCFEIEALLKAIDRLSNKNAQGEYYLTDCIELIQKDGGKVSNYRVEDPEEGLGINDREQLAYANSLMRERILKRHMKAGVTIIDPKNTYIDIDVKIGCDTTIYPGNYIKAGTVIGEGCILKGSSTIEGSIIKDGVQITSSTIMDSNVGCGTTVGPYAYLRPGSSIGERCRIGDYVEIKNSTIGDGTKVSHLTYVGDANVGKACNIGCGTVFVNYDGKNKYRINVGNNVFVGCNTNLIAPVKVEDGAYIAAGSTVTDTVPEKSLCIARSRQVIKENWAEGKFSK